MQLDPTGIDPTEHALARRCSVGDVLSRAADTFGDRTALVDAGGSWSYARLESEANRLARGLADLGVAKHEPVAIASVNCREFVASYFGVAKAGMVAMPVNLLAGAENIVHSLVDSGTRTLVAHADLVPLLEPALAMVPAIDTVVVFGGDTDSLPDGPDGVRVLSWDDALSDDPSDPGVVIADRQIVQCLYSSGTTSRPKGVLTSHLSVTMAGLSNAAMFSMGWGATAGVSTLVLPLFHTAALNGVLISGLTVGGTVHLLPGYDPEQFARTVAESRSTHLIGLPMMFEALVDTAEAEGLDLSAIEHVLYAMAPMTDSQFERIRAALPGVTLVLGSGMSECTPATVMQWAEDAPAKKDAWGHPSPSTANVIVEPGTGTAVPTGVDGELAYRGPVVMEGYWNNPEANAEAFRGGYLHSGDLGHLDDEHVVWFADRVKDIVKSGGENVSSLHVERVLADHPWVAEAACIGRPDPRWGEQVVAVVVPAEGHGGSGGADDEALREAVLAHGAEHLAPAQRPREVIVVEELPKTATGKIRKVELRRK